MKQANSKWSLLLTLHTTTENLDFSISFQPLVVLRVHRVYLFEHDDITRLWTLLPTWDYKTIHITNAERNLSERDHFKHQNIYHTKRSVNFFTIWKFSGF